jgi:N-acetylmuramoyl-L-alanine amidase
MFRAAAQLIGVAIVQIAAVCAGAAESSARALPSRPTARPLVASTAPAAALPTKKFGALEYVSLPEVAARLGLQIAWIQRGRKVTLTGPTGRAELENDTREITVGNLRVFLGDPVLDARGELYVSRIDFERCLTPLLRPGQGAPTLPPPRTIVLDPGHGGRDNGTSAKEKIFTLDVAQRAKKLLEAAGHRVVLTREADVFLDLPQRGAIANAQRADLFASIHFNALPNDTKTSGVEIFTFAPQFQRSTNSWSVRAVDDAEKEATAVNRYDHWSVVFAQALQRRFVTELGTFDRGKKLAHWGVLRGLNCPGVLIECGFLTSGAEARKIATPAYRQKLAEALAAGIRDYAATVEASRTKTSTVAAASRAMLTAAR